MGRQITVELADLKKAGCTFDYRFESGVEWQSTFGGEPIDDYWEQEWLEVTLPDGRKVGSDDLEYLVFDCRSLEHSANAWIERWLIEHNVPYVAG